MPDYSLRPVDLPTAPQTKAQLDDQIAALLRYINRTPELLSLLYDLDLMPEQIRRGSFQWGQMLILAQWFKVKYAPLKAKLSHQPPAPGSSSTP